MATTLDTGAESDAGAVAAAPPPPDRGRIAALALCAVALCAIVALGLGHVIDETNTMRGVLAVLALATAATRKKPPPALGAMFLAVGSGELGGTLAGDPSLVGALDLLSGLGGAL